MSIEKPKIIEEFIDNRVICEDCRAYGLESKVLFKTQVITDLPQGDPDEYEIWFDNHGNRSKENNWDNYRVTVTNVYECINKHEFSRVSDQRYSTYREKLANMEKKENDILK